MIDMFTRKPCWICGNLQMESFSWDTLMMKQVQVLVCDTCRKKLEPLEGLCCCKCSRMLSELTPDYIHGDMCNDCYRWEQDPNWKGVLERNFSLYKYNEFVKELMALFKYRGDYALAEVFAPEIRSIVSSLKVDYIIPVPLSEQRLQERGFNQSEALIEVAGLKPLKILTRVHSEKQSKKSRRARMELEQVFFPNRKMDLNDKQILIVDDIYTTGSTLRHAAKVAQAAGAKHIYSLSIAR